MLLDILYIILLVVLILSVGLVIKKEKKQILQELKVR